MYFRLWNFAIPPCPVAQGHPFFAGTCDSLFTLNQEPASLEQTGVGT
jgi:hypothetical protein